MQGCLDLAGVYNVHQLLKDAWKPVAGKPSPLAPICSFAAVGREGGALPTGPVTHIAGHLSHSCRLPGIEHSGPHPLWWGSQPMAVWIY